MPSFSDFAGFEGFYFVAASGAALPPDRAGADLPAATPSNFALVLNPKPFAELSADKLKDQL
jgi:hypothetical protein